MVSRKISVAIFILLLSVGESFAVSAFREDPPSYEQKLEQGIEAFYQTQWDEASEIFLELQSQDKEDPRAFFFDAMIPFWDYFFGGSSSKAADEFLEKSQKAIQISEERLKSNPHDTTMVLMLSGLHGYRSLVAASEKSYQTAIQSGMTGFTYTRQLLALDDDDPKALIGKGIFYYMVGNVPRELRWATNMMGIKGDREEGFQILEQAATSMSYVSNDAKMILAYLYEKEGAYQKALGHIKALSSKYQENIIFQYHYAELLNKTNQNSEARKAYQAVVALPNTQLLELKNQSRIKLRKL